MPKASSTDLLGNNQISFGICHLPFGIWHLAFGIDAESDSVLLSVPFQSQFARRGHVADERGGGDDRGAGEKSFAPQPHAVLPVAIERRDGALTGRQRVLSLAEA